jgi:hypothetical protein
MLVPGASRSTTAALLDVPATMSVLVVFPMVIAVVMQPGTLTPVLELLFPDDITVAILAVRNWSITPFRVSLSHVEEIPPPVLILTDEMAKVFRQFRTC